jgi:membrane-bound lytic murein transglycosylase D
MDIKNNSQTRLISKISFLFLLFMQLQALIFVGRHFAYEISVKNSSSQKVDSENQIKLITVNKSKKTKALSVTKRNKNEKLKIDQNLNKIKKLSLKQKSKSELSVLHNEATPSIDESKTNSRIKLSKKDVLNDKDERISKDFKIPNILKRRVGFWFDIYTKYDSNNFVLHHNKYPWLVFDVVNIQSFYKKGRPGWLSVKLGKKYLKKRKKQIRSRLLLLSKRKSFRKLNKLDRKLYKLIRGIRGPVRKNLKKAASLIRMQVGQKNYIKKGIKFSNKYLPLMEDEFVNHGLPSELTRIPFVESSFNVNAYSRVGASGIWQIMPRTAREFMILDKHIDERNSPMKATTFARKHLKRDFRILGSWPLAITAYNHGVGGVRKGIKKLKTRSITKLISYYKSRSFKFASRNFYTCFLAVLHAEKYKELYYDLPKSAGPLNLKLVKIKKKSRIQNIAKNMDMDLKILKKHNLDIKKILSVNGYLPKGFGLYVPIP